MSQKKQKITRIELPNADREQTFRSILRDEIEGAEMETMALEHDIALNDERCVIMLHLQNVDAATAVSILSNVVDAERTDALVEMDRHTLVLVKKLEEPGDYDEIDQLGLAIENTLLNETNHQVYIGIGEPKSGLNLLGH